jgi:hypothetical protein
MKVCDFFAPYTCRSGSQVVKMVASQSLYFTHIKTTPQLRQDLKDINFVLH